MISLRLQFSLAQPGLRAGHRQEGGLGLELDTDRREASWTRAERFSPVLI